MNLTLIKNFFLSDRKSIEPGKVGRVLRRSFRMKRPKQVLDGHREKRKSGKMIFHIVFGFERNSYAVIRVKMITHLVSTVSPNDSDTLKRRHFPPQTHSSIARNGRSRGPFPTSDWASLDRSTRVNRRWSTATWLEATCKRSHPKAGDSRRRSRSRTRAICCWYATKAAHRRCRWVCWLRTAVWR